MNGTDKKRKLAAVTGASSGIGWATALELAKRGYDVILIARRKDRLEELKARIESATSAKAHVLVADLSKTEQFQELADKLSKHSVDLFINNAGVVYFGNVVQQDPVRLVDALQVLVVSLTFLTAAIGAQMVKRGGGTIVNISSGIAYASVSPGNAVYAAAKRYVWDFTRAVNHENQMLENKVRVVSVQPGLIVSELDAASHPDPEMLATLNKMKRTSAEDFARVMVDGIEAGKTDFAYGELIEELKEAGKSQHQDAFIEQIAGKFGSKKEQE